MTEYRLSRPGLVDLIFEGERIGHASSRLTRRPRWTEVNVYRTDRGQWVTEIVGRTTLHGEHDRFQVTVCSTPVEVRESLKHPRSEYLTETALEALERAAENDAALETAATERI